MKFLKTTVIGGVFFLVPITLLGIIIAKLLGVMLMVAEPVAEIFPLDKIGSIAIVNIIAVLIIVLICFLAGLIARTEAAQLFAEVVETAILQKMPGYTIIKGITSSLNPEENEDLKPVLVRFGEAERIALEVERIGTDRIVVYLPEAPNAWSGIVLIVPAEHVKSVDISMLAVIEHAEKLGRGTHEMLEPGAGIENKASD